VFLVRWLPTVIAFPIGGELAILTVGSLDGPLTAALGGLLAGAVIGAIQWLALRSRGIGPRWAVAPALGMAVGSALAAILNGAATTTPALVLAGLVTGAFVGAAQATRLGRGRRTAAAWTTLVSLTWGAGWLVTANVIVDTERGYYVFGLSGAALVTMATGLVLRRILTGTGTPSTVVTSEGAALAAATR
jgi:hypothetical protein